MNTLNNKNLAALAIAAVMAATGSAQSNDINQPIPMGPIPAIKAPAVQSRDGQPAGTEQTGVAFDMSSRTETLIDNATIAGDRNIRRTPNGEFLPGSPAISRNAMAHEPAGETEFLETNKVYGGDGRIKINPANTYPWRTNCKMYMKFPSGNWYVGSATMIENNHAITAGHCVHDKDQGGWATTVQIVPGKAGASQPYGVVFATNLLSWTGWTGSKNYNDDMGVIKLASNVGNSTGWLGYGYWSNVTGFTNNIAGYPADRDGGNYQYYMSGPTKYQTDYKCFYKTDTAGGQSGSGVYQITNGNRYVFAAHSGWEYIGFLNFYTPVFDEYNRGTRITSAKFTTIAGWAK